MQKSVSKPPLTWNPGDATVGVYRQRGYYTKLNVLFINIPVYVNYISIIYFTAFVPDTDYDMRILMITVKWDLFDMVIRIFIIYESLFVVER